MGLTEHSFLERMEEMGFTPKKNITHIDKIREMTDEELAEFIAYLELKAFTFYSVKPDNSVLNERTKFWLEWLHKEYKEERICTKSE